MDDGMNGMLAKLQAGFARGTSEKWQVSVDEYPGILGRILAEWTGEATKNTGFGASEDSGADGPEMVPSRGKRLVRVAGQSGSGKTTQLVPAVEAWFRGVSANSSEVGGAEGRDAMASNEGFGGARPILVAASRIAKYHPKWQKMHRECDSGQVRRETDGFSAAMMFLLLKELLARGYDVILDLALVEPKLEGILVGWLKEYGYDFWMTMMVVRPELSQKWLGERSWRHSEETERRFLAATEGALDFYAEVCPEMRTVMWSAYGVEPIYDGEMSGAVEVWRERMAGDLDNDYEGEVSRDGLSTEELARRKVEYFGKG